MILFAILMCQGIEMLAQVLFMTLEEKTSRFYWFLYIRCENPSLILEGFFVGKLAVRQKEDRYESEGNRITGDGTNR